jgi:hypothetical protein
LANQIFAAAALSDIAVFSKAESHRAYMKASPDPETYDFKSDWPLAFGDL